MSAKLKKYFVFENFSIVAAVATIWTAFSL